MERSYFENIEELIIILNKTWNKYIQHCPWIQSDVEKAYAKVFYELCELLNAKIISKTYNGFLFECSIEASLSHCHYYINSLWRVYRKVQHLPDEMLFYLHLKMSDLLHKELKTICEQSFGECFDV